MNIIQIITELRPGGAERIVVELSKELTKMGHFVAVISLLPIKDSVIVQELQKNKIDLHSLHLSKYKPWRILSLYKILKKLQPDILHTHLIHANIISRIFKKKYRLINTVHTSEKRSNKKWHFVLDRLTFKRCDCMTVVSKAVQKFHAKKIGILPQCLPVVYNGISIPKSFSISEKIELRKTWNLSHCNKIIGSIGRLSKEKGYDLLLDLLPNISQTIPKNEIWGLVILGEGNQRKYLENAKNQCKNIEVRLPGFRKDAADCISAFDLFVMPSRYEGFGLTLAEAMAHGIPIIASNIDSLPELLNEYENGETVDFSDEKTAIIIHKKIYHAYGAFSRIFSIEKMVTEYIQLYNNDEKVEKSI